MFAMISLSSTSIYRHHQVTEALIKGESLAEEQPASLCHSTQPWEMAAAAGGRKSTPVACSCSKCLPSFPVEIRDMGRRRDIFGNVSLQNFLLTRLPQLQKVKGKKNSWK
ncbi:unnamed protein product [Natator depressus]